MKTKDVPQDGDFSCNGKYKEITYAVDETGAYEQVLSTGWSPKNEALKFAWKVVNQSAYKTGQKVIEGRLSPIAYYMEKNLMDIKILAQYMGLSKRKVKRHLQQQEFEKLTDTLLAQYADLFNISVKNLLDPAQIKIQLSTYED